MLNAFDILDELQGINNSISKIRIHKLMYLIYIEYYIEHGEELFKPNFQAWRYGPVEVSVYHKRDNGSRLGLTAQQSSFVLNIYNKYLSYNDFELVELTHKTLPWIEAYDENEIFHNRSIENSRIINYINNL